MRLDLQRSTAHILIVAQHGQAITASLGPKKTSGYTKRLEF
jgi:hypothetical protein